MLAVAAEKILFPVYASPKLDGIRCLIDNGRVLSRSLKLIPNQHVQGALASMNLHGLDGELIVGSPTAQDAMQVTSSGVMSQSGMPDFTFHVFDNWTDTTTPWYLRLERLKKEVAMLNSVNQMQIHLVEQLLLSDEDALLAYETRCLAEGYEGVMVRRPNGVYKYGRSTANEGYLLKVKRFVDNEAVILGFDPKLHNANVATKNELGNTKRSSHKENLVEMDTLGALQVQDIKSGLNFRVGTGMDDQLRLHIWNNRQRYLKQVITYKSFATGVKELPRFPVFKAFRDKRDMSE
jgi:DNA ligase-1